MDKHDIDIAADVMIRAEYKKFGSQIGCPFDALPDAMKWVKHDSMVVALNGLLAVGYAISKPTTGGQS